MHISRHLRALTLVGACCACFVLSVPATLHLLQDAVADGAQCLDGSAPGLYLRHSPNASLNWLVYLEGGGWCFNETSCYQRSLTPLGTSTLWQPTLNLTGMETDDCNANPHMCTWNVAYLPYCDGFSFAGDRADPIIFSNGTFTTQLWARGHRILHAVLQYLVANTTLTAAENVIVDGCSAGGLATYFHVDTIRSALPPSTRVVGIADAGFFGDLQDIVGTYYARTLMQYEFPMHNGSAGMRASCLADRSAPDAWQCATAQVAFGYIQTPVFVLQSNFDTYQLSNIFAPVWVPGVDPSWSACAAAPSGCSPGQAQTLMQTWGPAFRSALTYAGVFYPGYHGVFLHSCFTHCQWGLPIAVQGTLMYDAFWTWFTQARGPAGNYSWVDCTGWECNPTCGSAAVAWP